MRVDLCILILYLASLLISVFWFQLVLCMCIPLNFLYGTMFSLNRYGPNLLPNLDAFWSFLSPN